MNPFELIKDPDSSGITVRVKNNFVIPTREEERRVTKRITDEIFIENAKLRELVLKNWDIAMSERSALSAHGVNLDGNALDVEIRIARDKMREMGFEES